MCIEDQSLKTQRQIWLEQLRASSEGKIARDEDGVIITDFDPDRAPPAPKGYVYADETNALATIPGVDEPA